MDASYLCAIFTEHYASLSQSHCINPIKWPPLIAWKSTTTRLMASPPMRKILSSSKIKQGAWRLRLSIMDNIGELPELRKPAERTPKQQRALDVAARWAASRAGTVDEELATKYAEALAAIARRQPPKKSSGGDGGAEPPQKKQHC